MTQYLSTLSALAVAASVADKAANVTADKTTAHAPYALEAMLDNDTTVETWINDACDAASNDKVNVRSKKGKRNAQALREHGFTGLYNLANDFKWIADNRVEYPGIVTLLDMFRRVDTSGDMRRDYLIGTSAMLPSEAKLADIADIATLYANVGNDGDRAKAAGVYWQAVKAPSSWASAIRECKAHVSEASKADKNPISDKLTAIAELIASLSLLDIEPRLALLASVQTALDAATDKVTLAAELNAKLAAEQAATIEAGEAFAAELKQAA